MKKANVNLFDKNKVQVKLLKNKNLRISDGRKNPTKIVNLKKTGVTIWTDGKHLKIFRGNLLTEVIGRSVYRANKLETVEFVTTAVSARSIKDGNDTQAIGIDNIMEGRSVISAGTLQAIGIDNIMEGRSVISGGTSQAIGIDNIMEGRTSPDSDDILVIGSKNGILEGRSIKEGRAISIFLTTKSVIVRHGCI